MKNILVRTSLVGVLALGTSIALAQNDEFSNEIEKLEKGQLESKSAVPMDPSQSADEVESELNEEFGVSSSKKKKPAPVEAPDEIPEEISGTEPEKAPVVEQTQSPEELDLEDEGTDQKAEDFTPAPTPPEPVVEESVVEEKAPPEPVVEEKAPAPVYQEPAAPSYAAQESVPDDFEERLHRIYSQFYSEATSDTAWTQIAGEKIKETYTVQPGDTLWDISVTFFGNGHYWPKVWQMNDSITNPHLVSPGYVLKFVPGQIDSAPRLNIAQGESDAINPNATPEQAIPGTTELGSKVEDPTHADIGPVIPPPSRKYVPVLEDLPPSLPFIKSSASYGFDKDGFDIQNQKPKIQSAKVYLASYLVEEKPFNVGKIVEMNEPDDETATLYETVFVQMVNGATIGEKLTIYSLGDKIKDSHGDFMGYPVIQEGELQIQELVNSKEDVYKAIVTRSISNSKIGSLVSRSGLVVGDLKESTLARPINAEVVGGVHDNDRAFLGYQDVVYLNKGKNDGMKEGQVFTVLKSIRSRKASTLVSDLKEQIAKIKIMKTTPERATAIVLKSREYVHSGDFIGVQAKLPTPEELRQKNSSELEDELSSDQSDSEQDSDEIESELE